MDKLGEMDKSLEKYNLTRLNQEETKIMNRPITSTEIKTTIKNLSADKSLESDDFTDKFYQMFREELTPIILKLVQKFAKGEMLSNPFYEATISLILNPHKHMTKKKITRQYH